MPDVFPYQIVAFIDRVPEIGESAYNSQKGWYAQIALKRRFDVVDLSENEVLEKLKSYFATVEPLLIKIGTIIKPERMPVKVLQVELNKDLIDFHQKLIKKMGKNIISRYPERDGDNYFPHITAEYGGRTVIDIEHYARKQFVIKEVWLLKDFGDEDSKAYVKFSLSKA